MLRLRAQADTEDVHSVHHPINTIATNTLHRLGKELPASVRLLLLVLFISKH